MIGFVLKRIAGYLATLAGAAVVVFLAFDLLVRDPAQLVLGPSAGAGSIMALEHKLALDLPFWPRLLHGLEALGRGDFGTALLHDQPVAGLLLDAIGVTLPLLALAAVLAVAIGVPLGMLGARDGRTATALPASVAVVAGVAPVVVLALLLAELTRGTQFSPLEPAGWSEGTAAMLTALLLPGLAAALPTAGLLALKVRDAMRAVRAADFIRTAEAQGLTRAQAMRRTGRRPVAISVLDGLAPLAALLVVGVYVAEACFRLPGLSALIDAGLVSHDLTVLRGGVLAFAGATATVSLLIDLVRAGLDPRIATRAN